MLKIFGRVSALLPRWRSTRSFFTPWRISIIASAFFGAVYVGLFAIPKRVNFSYATPTTCSGQLSLLPAMNKTINTAQFSLQYRGGFTLGNVPVATTKVCFVATTMPAKGTAKVASAPFGGPVFRQDYNVAITEAPRVIAALPQSQTLAKPLFLKLSQPDAIFHYALNVGGVDQACTLAVTNLHCDIDELGLKQGTAYEVKLKRLYDGKQVGDTTSIQLAILPAVKVVGGSIAAGSVVFAKPQSVDITVDHTITAASAKLEEIDGAKSTAIAARVRVNGVHAFIEWDAVLSREKVFKITLATVSATDGSMLDAPYELPFQTSGGPKVVGSSIGGGGAAPGTQVLITFDQPLATNANVAGLAHITGGPASISRRGNNQVIFALGSIGRCSAFTLSIDAGIVGGNGVTGTQPWSQASRINCRQTRTIGYSVKGRPIFAYFYGSGSSTILFTGGIHGNEPSGTYIMQDWANYLDTNAFKIPAGRQVVVVPNINPDGIATNQRYDAHNVNLDRNFPSSDWVSDISLTNGSILAQGGGSAPFSEPETRAIADLTTSLRPRAVISFHSSGAIVGANKIADSVAIGFAYASGVGYGTMFYNPEQIMGYTLTGEYETWMGEKYGTPAILIELPTSTGRYFSRHLDTLWVMVSR